jgi:hypothetical protein
MCVLGLSIFVTFYEFDIGFMNCSDSGDHIFFMALINVDNIQNDIKRSTAFNYFFSVLILIKFTSCLPMVCGSLWLLRLLLPLILVAMI